jgi:hypothetical protein
MVKLEITIESSDGTNTASSRLNDSYVSVSVL